MGKLKVWDGFIRSFHWLLVIAIATLYFSAEEGMLELHFVAGFFTLALLLTRFIWGVIGSKTAKLTGLIHSPLAAIKSFKLGDTKPGHGAAGSYMVITFFILIFTQLISGLMTTDDILTDGPLVQYVSSNIVEWAGWVHHRNFDLLFYAIILHISAIVIYRLKGKKLVKAMITGKADAEQENDHTPVTKAPWTAFVIFVVLLLVLMTTWGAEPLSYLFS
ncbi:MULTISPECIES: cytochrome b/b6 domain-containing protein [unclassified Pseudoalteromonas]|uniref:cytochrome b/b6 domain-containing protein n=1 Tax=unclassified Pseudoalteromonas TaxID=194690 RepID=UPI0025B3FF57|nr:MULTISPECIES: cytochrome b/b6 domain-containing protein [unclassified Pseudoalteromonas]MDN3378783.1 cytochrome b/b6 domain-containing protein [Pseudoalteromonas sp. APC 3893]MDN3387271.1 cytochrome b/b6 domain-containing protein [Pseudoalteromonas sp. APC 4017]